MVSEQNPLDLNVFMFIVCNVWILRLSSCRNMHTCVFLLWFNLHMIFTTDPKLYVWSSNKQLLMQKLLIDEFRYSTCCNKFRTFIIKVTSICNINFTEKKKIYSLRHESKHYNDALFAQNDENSRNTCIYKSQCSYSNACKEYNMSMWHYVQSCSISHSKPRPRDKRNE